MSRKLFTFNELESLGLLAITVTSHVIYPEKWYYTKYLMQDKRNCNEVINS